MAAQGGASSVHAVQENIEPRLWLFLPNANKTIIKRGVIEMSLCPVRRCGEALTGYWGLQSWLAGSGALIPAVRTPSHLF